MPTPTGFPVYDRMPGPGDTTVPRPIESWEEERLAMRGPASTDGPRALSFLNIDKEGRPTPIRPLSTTAVTAKDIEAFLQITDDVPFATQSARVLLEQKDRLQSRLLESYPQVISPDRKPAPYDWRNIHPSLRKKRAGVSQAEILLYNKPDRELEFEDVKEGWFRVKYKGQTQSSASAIQLPMHRTPRVKGARFERFKDLFKQSITTAVLQNPPRSLSALKEFCVSDAYYKLQVGSCSDGMASPKLH